MTVIVENWQDLSKGTVVNQTCNFINWRSLGIRFTVPLILRRVKTMSKSNIWNKSINLLID